MLWGRLACIYNLSKVVMWSHATPEEAQFVISLNGCSKPFSHAPLPLWAAVVGWIGVEPCLRPIHSPPHYLQEVSWWQILCFNSGQPLTGNTRFLTPSCPSQALLHEGHSLALLKGLNTLLALSPSRSHTNTRFYTFTLCLTSDCQLY